ncbi:flagellar basal body P-ring protein FlgI [Rheinheimera aquimaris]|jgi:flagellar P-ring protein precursor FlgI|uniref:flagellar basal body P-ring protein FlgI n=1 Tax=Rheinheimera aquimaris TaxID=412437 RepID=UPI0010662B47|nr:flagellar basal body P-ring protein FlgI [Rheinheimera aquimaris]MCD1600361.1 flagellar basal body P-ring protein FlgI [Rheinheimera aquimaris]|tara:strand:+ start:8776 stop:9891 length:1116 start_codon:yes stop_codon:yes gene_type:complete
MRSKCLWVSLLLLLLSLTNVYASGAVRIRDISRIEGVRDNSLVGYGIVVGLAGSGDTSRNSATLQSVRNTLQNFGLTLKTEDIRSSNAAAVIVTAELPPFAQPGDRIDVNVSSIGDARSLSGGTLFMTPLKGADERIYALAQGVLSIGGYRFESNQNVEQRNHPTSGYIPQGALVEKEVETAISHDGSLSLVLNQPDFITAERMVQALRLQFPQLTVKALHAGRISVQGVADDDVMTTIANIQQVRITPATLARVVVNEKTGTIVSGADVRIDNVVISHGGIRLKIDTQFFVSQPQGLVGRIGDGIQTTVVPQTELSVTEDTEAFYANDNTTSIAELVDALKTMRLSTRDIISILQALKQSGALHAELVVQ